MAWRRHCGWGCPFLENKKLQNLGMGLELLFGVALGCAVSFFEAFLGRFNLYGTWWQAIGFAVLWRYKALGGILEDVIKDLAYPLTAIWSLLNIDDTRAIS